MIKQILGATAMGWTRESGIHLTLHELFLRFRQYGWVEGLHLYQIWTVQTEVAGLWGGAIRWDQVPVALVESQVHSRFPWSKQCQEPSGKNPSQTVLFVSNQLHDHCMEDKLDGVCQTVFGVSGPIPMIFKQECDFTGSCSFRGDPASEVNKVGLEPVRMPPRDLKSMLAMKEYLTSISCPSDLMIPSPHKHSCPWHCPTIAEACHSYRPPAPPLPQAMITLRNKGLKRTVACYHRCLSPYDPLHDSQSAHFPLSWGTTSHTCTLLCCNTHSAHC